jgi:quercetin dioxygenase-like cupin family protein
MPGMTRTRPAAVLAAAASLAVLGGAAPAQATPATGVSAKLLHEWTVGGTHVAVRRITIAPGGETGHHYHDGPIFGVIRSGTLTHYGSDCAVDGVYRAGDLIYEPAGPGNVHIGRNEHGTPLVLDATYVLPAGAPFVTDAAAPPCAGG